MTAMLHTGWVGSELGNKENHLLLKAITSGWGGCNLTTGGGGPRGVGWLRVFANYKQKSAENMQINIKAKDMKIHTTSMEK